MLWTAAIVGGLPVYVRPQIDQLRRADAILVLGGYGKARYDWGWASKPRDGHRPSCCLTRTSVALRTQISNCIASSHPPTTKGEAKELRRLAEQYGWRTVIVVTFRPHISRARFILEQCFDGDLILLASPTHISATRWAYEYVYQTAGYLRALLQQGC